MMLKLWKDVDETCFIKIVLISLYCKAGKLIVWTAFRWLSG